MWAAGKPPPCAGPPADCTHPNIRSSGSPPHRALSWNSTGKSASSSKWTPPAPPGPSLPSSSENRSWRSPGPQEETRPHHRWSLPPQASNPGRVAYHHSVSGRLQANPAHHIILAGQNNLADLLIYRTSLPLASRVMAISRLDGASLQDMQDYLLHYLKIAGIK
ncbi:hypothetical protein DFAR_3160005 [Desulfarculales bacterium]